MRESLDADSLLSSTEWAALAWSVTAVAIVTTALRLGARIFIVKALGLDDALLLVGQV